MVIKTSGIELSEDVQLQREFSPSNQIKFGNSYWAKVRSFNIAAEKPLTVGRIYKGQEIEINCYVTERIKELYQDGKLAVDDYVLVQFIDGDQDKPVAVAKAHKTW